MLRSWVRDNKVPVPAALSATYFPTLIIQHFPDAVTSICSSHLHFCVLPKSPQHALIGQTWETDKPCEEKVCLVFQWVIDVIKVISCAHFLTVAVKRMRQKYSQNVSEHWDTPSEKFLLEAQVHLQLFILFWAGQCGESHVCKVVIFWLIVSISKCKKYSYKWNSVPEKVKRLF